MIFDRLKEQTYKYKKNFLETYKSSAMITMSDICKVMIYIK